MVPRPRAQFGRSRLVLGAHVQCPAVDRLLGGTPCRPLAGEPGDYPVTQSLGPRSQDLEPHGADWLEGPDVAYPSRAPAFPVGVTELLGPWGRGD